MIIIIMSSLGEGSVRARLKKKRGIEGMAILKIIIIISSLG